MNTTTHPVRATKNITTRHGTVILTTGEEAQGRIVEGEGLFKTCVLVTNSRGLRSYVSPDSVVWL